MKNKQILWLYILSASTYFLQGIEGVPGSALFFYLKETLHFNESTIMYIGTITGLAWLIKPLWGYLTDNYFTKNVWIYISLIGSLLTAIFFGLMPFLPLVWLVLLLSLNNWNTAMRDVAVDGIACIEGKASENTGKIQAIQWTSVTVAAIMVGLGGGYVAEHFNYQLGFLCLIPFYLVMIGIVWNYTRNCRTCHREIVHDCANCKSAKQCPKYVFEPSILVTNCPNHVKIIDSGGSFVDTLKSYKVLVTNKTFLFACLFLFLYKYSPSFGTPLAFIERDVFGWSKMWMGTLGAIVSGFEILGAILYFKYSKKIDVKKCLIWSVGIGAITTLAYLYFTPVTAVVYGICFSVLGMFIHLIIMDFMARTSLPGKEATSFALLCSISNLAGTASSLSGAALYPMLGLQPLIVLSAVTSFSCLFFINKLKIK
jgi:MFS family permease